jgi:hypothetical protein
MVSMIEFLNFKRRESSTAIIPVSCTSALRKRGAVVRYRTVHLIRRVIIAVTRINLVRAQRCNDPMITADVRKDVVSMVLYDLVSATVVAEETAEALVPLGFS